MTKVETLTPAQWEDMRIYRTGVLDAARKPGPVDRDVVESGVRACYAHIGLPSPTIVWVDGPTAVPMAGWMLKDQLRDNLADQLRGQLRGQLWRQLSDRLLCQLKDQLWDQLADQLWGHLWDHLWDNLWDNLADQLRDQLTDQLWDHLADQLLGQLRGHLWDHLTDQLWYQLKDLTYWGVADATWDQLRDLTYWGVAAAAWDQHYRWISTIVPNPPPAEQLALLDHWINASSAGVWLPLAEVAIMSEKHTACHVDSNGALHHETRPAWEWADGTQIWAWRGTRVPEWVITDCTVDRIDRETNAEILRCAIEHYGEDRYLASIGATN